MKVKNNKNNLFKQMKKYSSCSVLYGIYCNTKITLCSLNFFFHLWPATMVRSRIPPDSCYFTRIEDPTCDNKKNIQFPTFEKSRFRILTLITTRIRILSNFYLIRFSFDWKSILLTNTVLYLWSLNTTGCLRNYRKSIL